jgi:GTP-binding nuclear protein Ran
MTILVVGDGGVGKTSFIRALADEDWEPRYIADEKVTATDIEFNGCMVAMVDTPGQYKFSDQCLPKVDIDGIIVMYDVHSLISFKNVKFWINKLEQVYGNKIPIVVCGNKIERSGRKVPKRDTVGKYKHVECSVKEQYQIHAPIEIIEELIATQEDLLP